MSLTHSARKFLWKFGYDIVHFRPDKHYIARRRQLIQESDIDLVLDVGANIGQFAMSLRNDYAYSGEIVSFEPLSSAFKKLAFNSRSDPRWTVVNCALGESDGVADINIAGNSYSSSFLDMLPAHMDAAPESTYTGREQVVTRRLDSEIDSVSSPDSKVYLKIDVQGFERRVIAGAERALDRIKVIQLEMSLTPLYDGESSFAEMHDLLQRSGFHLFSLEPGFADKRSGQLLQVDGIYCR